MKGRITKRGFPLHVRNHNPSGVVVRGTFNKVSDSILPGVSYYQGESRHASEFFRCYLGIAAGDNNPGVGIPLLCTSDELAGLIISFMGDRTGVDNVNICLPPKIYNLKTFCQQGLFDGYRIILINFAPKGGDSYFHCLKGLKPRVCLGISFIF